MLPVTPACHIFEHADKQQNLCKYFTRGDDIVEAYRAKEIADSPDMIIVSYLGVPVFIEHVNLGAGTARIHTIDRPEEEQTVPVDVLSEDLNDEFDTPFM